MPACTAHPRAFRFQPRPLAAAIHLVLAGMLAAGWGSTATAQSAAISRQYDISAGPLDQALTRFAQQAGVAISVDAGQLKGLQTKGLQGNYGVDEGFATLLRGSGYAIGKTNAGYVLTKATSPEVGGVKAAPAKKEATYSEAVLPEITVVAITRTASPLSKVPASVSIANAEAFEEIQAATIAPIVRSMPNVEMGGGPRVEGLIPTIRGAYGASVTLLMDGARQNDLQAPGMKSPFYIDPYFIKELEVLRGASSSLYGTGGNGGVLSVTTLSARDLLIDGKTVGGGVRAGYNSSDSSNHLNARVFAANEEADLLLAVGQHDWDKIKQPGGTYIDPNDGRSVTGLIKLGINPSEKARVEFSHQLYQSNNLEINNPQANIYRSASATGAPYIQPTSVDQYNTVLKLTHGKAENPDELHIETSIYASFLGIQHDPYAANPKYNNTAAAANQFLRTETKTEGANLILSKQVDSHRWAFGADTYSDHLISKSGTTGAVNSVNPAGERTGIGTFLQDEYQLGNGWKITPTLRYDRFDASEANSAQPNNSHGRFSPKLALAWENGRGLMAYGSYGEGFRAPSVAELYNDLRGIFPLSNFYRNPTLKPEIDRTVEFGSKLTMRGVLRDGDVLKARGAVFNSSVHDLISNVNLGQVVGGANNCAATGLSCIWQYQNITHAERIGGEIEASYSQGLWQYKLGYGRVRVRNTDTGENLFSNPDKLTTQIRRAFPDQSLSVLWNGTFISAQDYDSTPLRRRSGYTVHDVFISWAPSGQNFRVDAGVTNVFNKTYMIYQSANAYAQTPQPARSYLVSVNTDF